MGRGKHHGEPSGKPAASVLRPAPAIDLQLRGDVSGLRDIFANPKRRLVGTLMPESLHDQLRTRPGGISAFYESAIATFDGNLPDLLAAAARFIERRKTRKPQDALISVNGRVSPEAFQRLQSILAALHEVRGVSRAKVLAGLVQLVLNA